MDLNPIRFGPAQRQIFAMHHIPAAEHRGEGVLLCNPFGQEAIRCHRLFRILADQLTRQGFHVMRFDYFATGDSAGEDGDGDLDLWCDDVLSADEEFRLHSDCNQISWFGLRLGASIAALASQRAKRPPNRLLLWDPVIDGPAYLEEIAAAHMEARRASFGARWTFDQSLVNMARKEIEHESLGFALPKKLRIQLEQLSAAKLASTKAKSLSLLLGPEITGEESLRQKWAEQGKSPSLATISTKINWTSNEAMNSTIVPLDALHAAVALLKGTE